MNATVYIANITPLLAAHLAQSMELSGTSHAALGFGGWGVEPTTVIRFGNITREHLESFIQEVFTEYPDEESVYVETDSRPGVTVYRQGPCTECGNSFDDAKGNICQTCADWLVTQ